MHVYTMRGYQDIDVWLWSHKIVLVTVNMSIYFVTWIQLRYMCSSISRLIQPIGGAMPPRNR